MILSLFPDHPRRKYLSKGIVFFLSKKNNILASFR
jgi:hypothetical protein